MYVNGIQPSADELTAAFFGHTRFVPAADRLRIGRRLAVHLDRAASWCTAHLGDGAALYLAGSLARSEASVVGTGHDVALASDLDFVLVVDDPDGPGADGKDGDDPAGAGASGGGPAGTAAAEVFARAMNAQAPDLLTTCFHVRRRDLPRVRSFFGVDLWLGLPHPLAGGGTPPGTPAPRVGPRETLEVVVHQLAALLLLPPQPGGVRGSSRQQLRKLLLEGLRANVPVPSDGVLRYADILGPAGAVAADGLLAAAQTEALVRARELSLPNPIGSGQAVEAAVGLLQRLFVPEAGTRVLPETLDVLEERLGGRGDVLSVFQTALTAMFLLVHSDVPAAREAAAGVLLRAWRAADPADLTEAAPHRAAMCTWTPRDFVRDQAVHTDTTLRAMRALRLDYYGRLGPHNFGRRPSDSYTWHHPREGATQR
ncbi:hypothetical protein OK074_1778 [Actinobacteria bacterium OK074]|nr:hypothetical protein OK074_1778 [Actinobacteria bacterium OK074]